MTKTLYNNSEILTEGIKAVGVGKKGSKSLTAHQSEEILNELRSKRPAQAAVGAFFGALLQKGLDQEEYGLVKYFSGNSINAESVLNTFAGQLASALHNIYKKLLNGSELTLHEAETLGDFLLTEKGYEALKGMAASVLRVRYETIDEYEGLLKSIQKTISERFNHPVPSGDPVIQLAEPFDGVDHSFIITPLISDYLQNQGYRTVNLTGRNSGPKFVYNLLDIAEKLNASFIESSSELANRKPLFGFFIHQKKISEQLDAWVDIRRQIIKRPFLATVERFVNPVQADYIIVSAFHPPYGEKMLLLAQRAGYKGIIVIRNGVEGGIAFPLMRQAKILCSVKSKQGEYTNHEFSYDAQKQLGIAVEKEEKFDEPSIDENIRLINEYTKKGRTDYNLFNWRVQATTQGIKQALDWINQKKGK